MEPSQTDQTAPAVFDIPRQLGIYRLTRFLGRGGMGEVWRAFDTQLERDVALKLLHRDQLANEEAVKRFYREARAVAKLNHPHIMHVHAIGEQNGIIYLVMEMVEGENLARRLADHGPMPLSQALQIVQQTVAGLGYAHTRGIIHRDIKPSNLMLAEGFQIKITDFGLAKAVEQDVSTTGSSAMLGTPAYISPEQIRGLAADHRSDIYALGCTFFQLLTGELPFRGPMATVLLKHIQEPLPEPEHLVALRDGAVMAVIRKMTAKNPDDRFQTYGGLSAALAALETGAPLPLTETPRPVAAQRMEEVTVQIPVLPAEPDAVKTPVTPSAPTVVLSAAQLPDLAPAPATVTRRRKGMLLMSGLAVLGVTGTVFVLQNQGANKGPDGPVTVSRTESPSGSSGSTPLPARTDPPPPLTAVVGLQEPTPVPTPAPADPPPPLSDVLSEPPALTSIPPSGTLDTLLVGHLPQPTQMHGSAIIGNRLFIFGGENLDGWSDQTWSATIGQGGQLGEWRRERPLPERRAYIGNSVRVANNRIYIIGGLTPLSPDQPENVSPAARDVLWTSVLLDGTLAPWERSEEFLPGEGLYNIAAASDGQRLYATGGFYSGYISGAVFAADLQENGSPTHWRQVATLPASLWFHGAGVIRGKLYVWGGLPTRANTSVNAAVYSAAIDEDGSLAPWEQESDMPMPTYSASYCAIGDTLLSVAGRYQNGPSTDAIWSMTLGGPDHGTWESRGSDLEARMYHSFGIDAERGWVFVTGGRHRSGAAGDTGHFVDAVQAFRVVPPAGAAP